MSEGLTSTQRKEVEDIAKIGVREYFDHYLEKVKPIEDRRLREYTHLMIERHDANDEAHGGVEVKVNRTQWMMAGVALASGGGGALVAKLLGA